MGFLLIANNRINSHRQFRCAPLPSGYAERSHFAFDDETWEHMVLDLLLVTPQTKTSWDSKISVDWEGKKLKVLAPEGLILLKSLRKSGQDIDDIEYLKELIDED